MRRVVISPHAGDALLGACGTLLGPDDVQVLTFEGDDTLRRREHEMLDFMSVPYQHIDLEMKDTSYFEYWRRHKRMSLSNVYAYLRAYYGSDVLNDVSARIVAATRTALRGKRPSVVMAPLGVGHPFNLFVSETIRDAISAAEFYFDTPYGYDPRVNDFRHARLYGDDTLVQMKEIPVEPFEDVKWGLESRFRLTDWHAQRYFIYRNAPEEIWTSNDLPF